MSTSSTLLPLSLAIPGWKGQLIPEAVVQAARGVALEQQRLRGSVFLVVIRVRELAYDGYYERLEIVSGHVDIDDALAACQMKGSMQLVESGRSLDQNSKTWTHDGRASRWPAVAPKWRGRELPYFADRLTDGTGWNAVDINVAIVATHPECPIDGQFVETIGMTTELVNWFAQVAGPLNQRATENRH